MEKYIKLIEDSKSLDEIPENILQEELKNGIEESELLRKIIDKAYSKLPNCLKNNKDFLLEYLKKNPGRIEVIGEELLTKELALGKDEEGNYRKKYYQKNLRKNKEFF